MAFLISEHERCQASKYVETWLLDRVGYISRNHDDASEQKKKKQEKRLLSMHSSKSARINLVYII